MVHFRAYPKTKPTKSDWYMVCYISLGIMGEVYCYARLWWDNDKQEFITDTYHRIEKDEDIVIKEWDEYPMEMRIAEIGRSRGGKR